MKKKFKNKINKLRNKLNIIIHKINKIKNINKNYNNNNKENNKENNDNDNLKTCRICYDNNNSNEFINPCKCKGSIKWVHESVIGYKDFFDDFELDYMKYVNSGFMIFNKSHKKLFQSLKQLYYDNIDKFMELQDVKVRKGNDQTPVNYMVRHMGHEINYLPKLYNMTHLQRKEILQSSNRTLCRD